ncbi:aldo/keto reductase [Aegicerativicinus sediminis]|uniref:aldo/keto reductase n=1 Tax=Aegicerativicinus sediminis TaxID=2893202 RepID=UPI00293BA6AE|nr:aldo/keto reductase [Aegicerativicinus sediminis]
MMEYRDIGHSDLQLSAITFGAWAAGGWMWGGTDYNEAVNAIRTAYDCGVTSIDTAPAYGMGQSEKVVGDAIKELKRDHIQILTKFGLRWDIDKGVYYFSTSKNDGTPTDMHKYAGKESIIVECEASLRRLGTDYIDLYQIHWPDLSTPIEETMEAVQTLIDQGKVRFAGVCNYKEEQLIEAKKYIDIISDQLPFSMVKRGIETDPLPYTIRHGMSVLAYSPLERGLLTGKLNPHHQFAEGDHRANYPYFKPVNIERTNSILNRIKPIADEHEVTLAQLVLRWTVEQPGITVALAGARNSKQAKENAEAMDIPLHPDQLKQIDEVLVDLKLEL